VTAASRSRKLLRVMRSVDGSGPGLVAMLLIVLAVVLAGTAALLRLRRHGPPAQVTRPYELVHDGQPGDQAPGLSVTPPVSPADPASVQRRGEMLGGAALVGGQHRRAVSGGWLGGRHERFAGCGGRLGA